MKWRCRFACVFAACLAAAARADEAAVTADIVYGHKYGLALTCDRFAPAAAANGASVIFVVSGGWYSNWSSPERLRGRFEPLTDRGFTVFAVRHGSSPKFSMAEALEDVRRSVRFIRHEAGRLGVDPDRIGVLGVSAGGHLALMLGTTGDDGDPNAADRLSRTGSRVQAVCAWVAPTDLRAMAWSDPQHDKQYDRFPALDIDRNQARLMSPLLAASADDAPTLLVNGGRDEIVPPVHGTTMHEALQRQGVDAGLLLLEEAPHRFEGEDQRRANDATVEWFERRLAVKPAEAP